MASVVLQAVGTYLGGPIGGAIGSAIGTYIDAQIIASLTPTQQIEGPRLKDVRLTAASEGAVIPRVYSRMRVGGTIIWATDFREETETTSQGGGKGGGGGVETTEYRYACSFAVALCEGEISGIGRIWADGKPFDVPGAVYRVYTGSETQDPDPFMETKMGAGNVPAYRGTAYIVFEELPLEKFGNRLPQLSFEVFRYLDDPQSPERLIRSVNIIPSAGEFVYATETILRGKPGETQPENVNSTEDRPDFLVSLDQLETAAPNIESASLVVSWFGTDLRVGECEIRPGIEHFDKTTLPTGWAVNGVERADAYRVSRLTGSDDPAYGGTPADSAIVQAIQEMKSRGLRVTFYPFVLMDIADGNSLPNPYSDNAATLGQPAHPWRGRITCSPAAGYAGSPDKTATAADQIDAFFGHAQPSDFAIDGETVTWTGNPDDWGFRRMILHYAHLCAAAGGVDAFLIGSELRGLTQIRSSASTYPAVEALRTLAADCRSILGAGTKISYAADWSEYFGHHPADGSGDVFFHLDPLWADANIDFIGIDNYMPLSDWRDGVSHLDAQAGWKSIHDRAYLEANIEGGEGYDWHYASQADRDAQIRTLITDGTGKPWVFRYKDLRAWWSNDHIDRPGGIESASPTAWVPESKPIRFTEAGCPAVDKGTNQPNVFVDPKSSESHLPYYSRGARDDAIQRRYIEALYLYWAANNPSSSVYSGPMLDLGELSIWCWDARPYPAFPGRSDVWLDFENWRLGHWLTGRLGIAGLAQIVRDICLGAGLADSKLDVSELAAPVSGYLIEALESPRASIDPLARYFGFDSTESQGVIRFVLRGGTPAVTIRLNDLVATDRNKDDIDLTRGQETELPRALKWRLIRADDDYGGLTVEARRITVDTARIGGESFQIATSAGDADTRCRRALLEAWIGREQATFALPPSRLALDPTDIALLDHDGRQQEFRLTRIADTDARTIEAVRTDSVLYGARPGPERPPSLPPSTVYGPPAVAILDLPLINEDVPAHRPYAAVHANPWYGQAAVYRSPTQDGFALLDTIGRPARMGELAFDFHSGPIARFDLGNELYVDLLARTLASVTDIELFGGANALAVEAESGVWEIVQFAQAELVGTQRYKLTRLLRGQMGTETAMRDPVPAGARVVVLDTAVAPLSTAEADIGLAYNWRIGPVSKAPSDAAYASLTYTPAGIGQRPYAVAHIRQPWKYARQPGDLEIRWIRRTRSPAGDNWTTVDAPLYEESERYEVDILGAGNVLRTLSSNAPSVIYTGALQTADLGAPLGPGDQLDIAVFQISAIFGRGAPRAAKLYF